MSTLITSIPHNEIKNGFIIYPNPASDLVFLNAYLDGGKYSIFNMNGQLIIEGKIDENMIDVSVLLPGVYILNIDGVNRRLVKIKK